MPTAPGAADPTNCGAAMLESDVPKSVGVAPDPVVDGVLCDAPVVIRLVGAGCATACTCWGVIFIPVAVLTMLAICAGSVIPIDAAACKIACWPWGVPILALIKSLVPAGNPAIASCTALFIAVVVIFPPFIHCNTAL